MLRHPPFLVYAVPSAACGCCAEYQTMRDRRGVSGLLVTRRAEGVWDSVRQQRDASARIQGMGRREFRLET